jgi:hypothetical protein
MDISTVVAFAFAALIGVSVGVGELVSRYRDAPLNVARSPAGIGYIALNGLASLSALTAARAFGWTFGATGDTAILVTQVCVAGFGAMALFRSSLFTVRAGGQDVGIGPASLLSAVLSATDRGADRDRARARGQLATYLMRPVSYTKAKGPLPVVAVALMQNLDSSAQAALSVELATLDRNENDLPDEARGILLGLAITNQMGEGVLLAAIDALGATIIDPIAVTDMLADEAVAMANSAPLSALSRSERRTQQERLTRLARLARLAGVGSSILGGFETASVPSSAAAARTAEPVDRQSASPGLPQTPQTPDPPAAD